MSDTEIKEQQPAPDFTLPAVGSDDAVKNGQVHTPALRNNDTVIHRHVQCSFLYSQKK